MENNKPTVSPVKATILMGLALFATQFGAGNLIFPPFLGRNTGSGWLVGFLGFFIMDVGLAAASVASVVANRQGNVDGVVNKIGEKPGKIMLLIIILCLGPIVCIPRTAATTYEMGIHTLMPWFPQWLFSAIFFAVTLLFVIRPTKVVDIIGNYLTPILLAVMVLLIVMGIVNPISAPVPVENVVPVHDGILNGYQTLDGLGGVLMTMMLVTAATSYGFKKQQDVTKLIFGADIISAVLLALVYGGLTYLGSTVSGEPEFAGLSQAPLLIAITNKLLGAYGVVALTIIVLMACLTTSVGLTSVAGEYLENVSHGKIKYKVVVIAITVFSFAMSNIGLDKIISVAAPILAIMYPPLIVLVISAFFDRKISKNSIAGTAAYFAFAASILSTVAGSTTIGQLLAALPFAEYGLGWVAPAILGALIGAVLPSKSEVKVQAENVREKMNEADEATGLE